MDCEFLVLRLFLLVSYDEGEKKKLYSVLQTIFIDTQLQPFLLQAFISSHSPSSASTKCQSIQHKILQMTKS